MWWLWLACSGSDDGRDGRDGVAMVETALIDTAVELAPGIAEALVEQCPFEAEVPDDADPNELHRVFLDGVQCNDGSPMPIYVRGATEPLDSSRWLIQFEGGGSCLSGADCVKRWCGAGFYDARKMSSRWSREVRRESGVASPSNANAFGGWNQVLFYYCSSDLWQGTQSDVVLSSDEADFTVHYEGAKAVDVALGILAEGLTSDDGVTELPPLNEANEVWLAGSSAGGMGVVAHLDRVAAELPHATVRGLIDAFYAPDPSTVADGAFTEPYLAENRRLWDEAFVPLLGGVADDSCLAAQVDAPWRCIDPGFAMNHVSTPFLVHQDLRDPVLMPSFSAHGATDEQYATGTELSLKALASTRSDIAVMGSTCGRHTVLGSRAWFQGMTVRDGLRPWSVHDGAVSWNEGATVVAVDGADGLQSDCPPAP